MRPDGAVEVAVHQVVRNPAGALLSEGDVRHVYRFTGDLVQRMDIEQQRMDVEQQRPAGAAGQGTP